MEKDIFSQKLVSDELIYKKDYYNNVFKKTEKIVCAVFFIVTNNVVEKDQRDALVVNIKDSALSLLEHSSKVVISDHRKARTQFLDFSRQLLHLRGLIEVAMQSNVLPMSYASVLVKEIEILLQTLTDYFTDEPVPTPLDTSSLVFKTDYRRKRKAVPSKEAESSGAEQGSRKDRIKDILQSKGQLGIKDISDLITDVSGKSIQRDLNALIKDGEVKRTGERRWSLYSLTASDNASL